MAYLWDDLQMGCVEVEWGGNNAHPTRRARAFGSYESTRNRRKKWISNAVVGVSTVAAIAMAAIIATTLVKSHTPIPLREGNPSNAEGIGSLSDSTHSPSSPPTGEPTRGPTEAPTVAKSQSPSSAVSELPSLPPSYRSSEVPSISPTDVLRAPPAPEPVMCVDEPGQFYNHAGDKVSCDWFATVGTYNYHKNCDKTDVGRACLLSCKDYNNCIMLSDPPSDEPSSPPSLLSSDTPSINPTSEPPKRISVQATGDAFIREKDPDANFGSTSWLKIDSPSFATLGNSIASTIARSNDPGISHALLRFDVPKHYSSRPVKSATLRIKAESGCSSGGYLERTLDPHWNEQVVTWNNAPQSDGIEIGRLGRTKSGFWYSVDVTAALLPGHKTLSLRLYPASSDVCIFVSKDKSDGDGPKLQIIYE